MELMTFGELCKATGRSKATLKRYEARNEIPTELGADVESGRFFGQAALDFVGTLRKNKRREPKEEQDEEPTEMDKRIEAVLNGAMRAAAGSAITFLRHEIESARAGKEWEYESRLHLELARMLSELEQDAPAPAEVTE